MATTPEQTTPEQDQELVVFDGGPWNGWWLTRGRLEDSQRAAARIGHDPGSWPGVALNYRPSETWRPNPEPLRGRGRVWHWRPATAEGTDHG